MQREKWQRFQTYCVRVKEAKRQQHIEFSDFKRIERKKELRRDFSLREKEKKDWQAE
jgi:hypothetical protein